jgi:hypothetical protein
MRKIILITSSFFVLVSCSSSDEKANTDKVVEKDSITVEVEIRDTITCAVEPITEAFYCKNAKGICNEKVRKTRMEDSLWEIKFMEENADLIRKKGNDLIIKSKNGDIIFTNKTDPNSDDFIEYHLSEVNDKFITLMIYYYESMEYMVVNTETGKSFKTWGQPVFNSAKTMVIAGNFDLMAGYTYNGIQLFGKDSLSWNLKMQWIIDDWGPGYMAWLNDSVILSKKFVLDQTDSVDGVRTEFMKINLRKERLN